MSIPTSPSEICTLASDLLKGDAVNSIDDPQKGVEIIFSRWYDQTRRSLLETGQYDFSCDRTELALSAEVPLFGYADAYALPSDYCGLRFIEDETRPLSTWEYTIERGRLLLDNSGAARLNIGYVVDVEDVSLMSATFRDLLAAELAFRVAMMTTGKPSDIARLEKLVARFKNAAQASSGLSRPARVYRSSRIAGARQMYRGTGTGFKGQPAKIF